MAKSAVRATKTAKANSAKQTNQLSVFRNHVYTMVAAFAGVVFGVLGSLGFVGSYLHSQFANETASLSHQIVSMMPSDMTTSACTVPAGSTTTSAKPAAVTAAHLTPAGNNAAPNGGNNGGSGGNNSSHNSFVAQMVSGTISDNGRNSQNSITQNTTNTERTTNTNDITTANVNFQNAHSGKATTSDTVNGGSNNTGTATNTNSSSTSYDIEN